MNQAQKQCTACGKTYPWTEKFFYRTSARRKDGTVILHSECKPCMRVRTRVWYYKHYDNMRRHDNAYHKADRERLKDDVFRHYGGWVCACCGETEPLFLALDHIDNNGSKFRQRLGCRPYYKGSGAGEQTYRWLRRNKYPPGFQVLCQNCNVGKHRNNGVCPHIEKAQRLEQNARKPKQAEMGGVRRIKILGIVT